MAGQREIQRLALFQDQANALGTANKTMPAEAWISRGDDLWTIITATYPGLESSGIWHESGDTLITITSSNRSMEHPH